MSSYDQGYTCIECEHSYDDRDGDLDERMCNECLYMIYEQKITKLLQDITRERRITMNDRLEKQRNMLEESNGTNPLELYKNYGKSET